MCGIGKTEDNPDAKGLSFLAHSKMKDCVIDFKTYSNRVTEMKKKPTRKRIIYDKKCLRTNIYCCITKELWLIVTQNIRSLQEILMQKLELKQEHGSIWNRGGGDMKEEIVYLNLPRNTN